MGKPAARQWVLELQRAKCQDSDSIQHRLTPSSSGPHSLEGFEAKHTDFSSWPSDRPKGKTADRLTLNKLSLLTARNWSVSVEEADAREELSRATTGEDYLAIAMAISTA
ncbi:hypothetical protein RRG08_006273 [Elysia crispata]|uniref:Uncharacterized protein n=1 Tax=Elysia crispata TaxID=231223 RepID=A0AAE0YQ28_9GAST|nr:hypothetical protein RRG08_006273 [Elysia crispata]